MTRPLCARTCGKVAHKPLTLVDLAFQRDFVGLYRDVEVVCTGLLVLFLKKVTMLKSVYLPRYIKSNPGNSFPFRAVKEATCID